MREVTLNFEVIGSYPVTIDVDDYFNEDDNWDEMTEEEKVNFVMGNLEEEGFYEASRDCEFSIGQLESISFGDGEEHWVGD